MRKFRFDKLVRDKIADSIMTSGGKVSSKILNDDEMISEAKKKLLEEAQELQHASNEELVEELSDIQELISLVCKLRGIQEPELNEIRVSKAQKTGFFEQRIYIETVEVPDDAEWVDYYLSQPDRYPEIK